MLAKPVSAARLISANSNQLTSTESCGGVLFSFYRTVNLLNVMR